MPVVDVQEHADRYGNLTGWAVVEWDGTVETSRFVHAHRGEPDTPLDLDAQVQWLVWTAEREKAKKWARDVWTTVQRTDWPAEVGDTATVRLTMPAGTTVYKDGKPVSFLSEPCECDYPIRVVGSDDLGHYQFRSASEEFPVLPDGMIPMLRFLATRPTYDAGTLARKRQSAVRKLVPGDGLWDMVFSHPEDEWAARWPVFTDALQDDHFGWGDEWVRVGEHLGAIEWQPPSIDGKEWQCNR